MFAIQIPIFKMIQKSLVDRNAVIIIITIFLLYKLLPFETKSNLIIY